MAYLGKLSSKLKKKTDEFLYNDLTFFKTIFFYGKMKTIAKFTLIKKYNEKCFLFSIVFTIRNNKDTLV